ncbi:MAG: magnesium transporter [Candidatus Omnitrophota bacterium]
MKTQKEEANNMQKTNRLRIDKEPQVFALFLPEIKQLLSLKNLPELKSLLAKIHSSDLAEGLAQLSEEQQLICFKLLGTKKSIEVFEMLGLNQQAYLLNNLDSTRLSEILNEMAADERTDLFKDLPDKVVRKFFGLMRKEEVDDVRKLLTYPEGTAGAIMTTEFVELKKDMTARRAILSVQQSQRHKNIYSVYVTSEEHYLLGRVSLQNLVVAAPDMLVKDIMNGCENIKINVVMDDEAVAKLFSKYDLLDAPVVSDKNVLLGIVTIDDIVDVIQEEATKDIYEIGKMHGVEIRYAQANVFDLVKRRAGWLIFLLVFDFLTGTVLKIFRSSIGNLVALTFFIPMLLDTGGNAGNQSAITIIRGLATGDVTSKNTRRVIKMEIQAALFMGAIVGVVAFMRAWLLEGQLILSIVVGVTMSTIVLLAIFTGVALPLISKRMGLDPAVLAGPITTSIVDVLGLIIYFKIAQCFIPMIR